MDKQQIANLLRIQHASRTDKLVVFVGAGVSQNSGIPTWNNLICSMMEELPSELSKENDVLKLAQMYKDSRGHKEYMDKIKNVLLYNKTVPNPLHKSIIALNPCHIITTNYDDLVEQELANEFKQYNIIREDKDIPQMEKQHCLVKMHGDYATDNIVLTEKDYFDYKNNFPLIRAFVQSLFASKLVLFVGFSFADLNLKMIMNELQNILSEDMQRAYLLSYDTPDDITKKDLYKVLIKYQSQNHSRQFDKILIEEILENYSPDEASAKALLWKLLCTTSDYQEYAQCIFNIVEILHDANITYDDFGFDKLQNKENIVTEISFIYSIVTDELRNEIREFSLSKIGNLHDFIYFIKHNEIENFPMERFEVLLEKDKNELRDETLFLLAEIRKDSHYEHLYSYIDELAKENDYLQFYLSPFDYPKPQMVKIDWLLYFNDEIRTKLFKNDIYKETLKRFILDGNISKSDKKYLMKYL